MGQKKALNGSHLEVFLALQHNTEHDFDLSISNVFLTFVQFLQEIKKKQKRGYAFKFQIRLKAFLEKFSFENNKLIKNRSVVSQQYLYCARFYTYKKEDKYSY